MLQTQQFMHFMHFDYKFFGQHSNFEAIQSWKKIGAKLENVKIQHLIFYHFRGTKNSVLKWNSLSLCDALFSLFKRYCSTASRIRLQHSVEIKKKVLSFTKGGLAQIWNFNLHTVQVANVLVQLKLGLEANGFYYNDGVFLSLKGVFLWGRYKMFVTPPPLLGSSKYLSKKLIRVKCYLAILVYSAFIMQITRYILQEL